MKTLAIIPILFSLFVISCDDSTTTQTENCGDGVVDIGEECDGLNLGDESCASLGYYGGELSCDDQCNFIITQCESVGKCGDGVIQSLNGEQCDGDDLAGETCLTVDGTKFYGGTLGCAANCEYDRSSCESTGFCGNNIIEDSFGEVCDASNLATETCETLGYYGGELKCSTSCLFDLSGCEDIGMCGDNTIQTSQGEECDRDNLDGATCEDFNFYGGVLSCDSSCQLDFSLCESEGICSDGIIQEEHESCDGTDLDGFTCLTVDGTKYYGGTLACNFDCSFDKSDCELAGYCGDSIIQGSNNEECDGDILGTETCASLNYYGGAIGCLSNCQYDLSQCEAAGYCGDGIIQGTYGETCDGTDLNGVTCNFPLSGIITCNADCTLNYSQCN